jgi:hypothetical protein
VNEDRTVTVPKVDDKGLVLLLMRINGSQASSISAKRYRHAQHQERSEHAVWRSGRVSKRSKSSMKRAEVVYSTEHAVRKSHPRIQAISVAPVQVKEETSWAIRSMKQSSQVMQASKHQSKKPQ